MPSARAADRLLSPRSTRPTTSRSRSRSPYAGEVVVLPHGTPFAWRNASADEPGVYLGVYAPGGFEKYFPAVQAAATAAGGLSPEVVGPLWEQYGIGVSQV